MFRTFDFVLVVVMTVAATITYTIKHKAENKLEEVRKLDAEIMLEEHTIDQRKNEVRMSPGRIDDTIDRPPIDAQRHRASFRRRVDPQYLRHARSLADRGSRPIAPRRVRRN